MKSIFTLVAIYVIATILLVSGAWMERRQNPVCHAITEDSVITDCNYRNGAWYRN